MSGRCTWWPRRARRWPARPGRPQRYDYEYERKGVGNVFTTVEPLAGWRHVEVTEHRTAVDFAQQMRWLVDEAYPQAEVIRVVLDNLNTHATASLYAAFPAAEARRRRQSQRRLDGGEQLYRVGIPRRPRLAAGDRQCAARVAQPGGCRWPTAARRFVSGTKPAFARVRPVCAAAARLKLVDHAGVMWHRWRLVAHQAVSPALSSAA
jgi:hypothetical protein